MIAFFIIGLGMAIGHHRFLSSPHNKTVSNQAWNNRYSLAMAFIVKSCFAAAILLAYAQRLWYTLQRCERGISIKAIDARFSAQETLLGFFTSDLWRSAFLATLMAIVIWLMPLSAVISPTALSVGSLTQ
jgi:hypothetical protein